MTPGPGSAPAGAVPEPLRSRRGGPLVRRALIESAQDRITTCAASLAFHMFLAFFPAVVAALGLVSLVGLSAAQLAGLDVAYEVSSDRGFLRRRLMSLPLIAMSVVLGGAASGLLVLGDPIRALLPSSLSLARSALTGLWLALRWGGALGLIMLLLSGYYSLGPNHDRPSAGVAAFLL